MTNGGVLSRATIRARKDTLFENAAADFDESCLRPAGYDMRVGEHAITPDGVRVTLAEDSPDGSELFLAPGESAIVQTREHLQLPADVAGNLSLKTGMANKGLLLLSGLLIDPEYAGPLHLSLANLGADRVGLRRDDKILAIQFLDVRGASPQSAEKVRSALSSLFNSDVPTARRPLAFLGDLRQLRLDHDEIAQQIRRTSENIGNVISLGFFLVSATILGIVFDTALSFGSNRELVTAVRRATPRSLSGKALAAVALAAAAWSLYSLAIMIRGRRVPQAIRNEDYYERAARTHLEQDRRLKIVAAMLGIIPAAVLLVLVSTVVPSRIGRFLWPAAVPVLLILWARFLLLRVARPVTAQQVHESAEQSRAVNPSEPSAAETSGSTGDDPSPEPQRRPSPLL